MALSHDRVAVAVAQFRCHQDLLWGDSLFDREQRRDACRPPAAEDENLDLDVG